MMASTATSLARAQHKVGSGAGEAAARAPQRTATEAAGVLGHISKATTTERGGRLLLSRWCRHSGEWNADEVAAHLMGCRAQMVRGLARKTPWAGLDDDTLDSCFGHAAAVIVKVAVSGQRPEWRTPRDLEKAQIAAYRHQAFDHWKRVSAQARQGDRYAVPFDPERHASEHTPMDRLFDQPDLHMIERDLLAELVDDRLRAFWTIVLREQAPFKTAGDRLGLSKSAVMACTRGGRVAFANYLDRRTEGELCRDRSSDIAARLAGTATTWRVERAEAHLEACYACALVHEPRTSAIERGILGIAPTGLILRLLSRAGDAASVPAMRIAESGSPSRAIAAGLAALSVAGAGLGAHRESTAPPTATTAPTRRSSRAIQYRPIGERVRPLRGTAAPSAAPKTVDSVSGGRRTAHSKRSGQPSRRSSTTERAAALAPPQFPQPQPPPEEFEIEAAPKPQPTRPAPPTADGPPELEFANP